MASRRTMPAVSNWLRSAKTGVADVSLGRPPAPLHPTPPPQAGWRERGPLRPINPSTLMEQPIEATCSAGPWPVSTTCFIASKRSRRAFGTGVVRNASSLPRYCNSCCALKPKKSGVHYAAGPRHLLRFVDHVGEDEVMLDPARERLTNDEPSFTSICASVRSPLGPAQPRLPVAAGRRRGRVRQNRTASRSIW